MTWQRIKIKGSDAAEQAGDDAAKIMREVEYDADDLLKLRGDVHDLKNAVARFHNFFALLKHDPLKVVAALDRYESHLGEATERFEATAAFMDRLIR